MTTALDHKIEIFKGLCSRQTELMSEETLAYLAKKHNMDINNIDDALSIVAIGIAEIVNSIYRELCK